MEWQVRGRDVRGSAASGRAQYHLEELEAAINKHGK